MEDTTKLSVLKRKAILEAAQQEFFARGYEGTSMDRVASVASVSKRTVYNHFVTKEALFHEVTNAKLSEVEQVCSGFDYDAELSLSDQLQWFALCQIQYFGSQEYLQVARLILMERLRSPNRDTDLEELFEQSGSGLEEWLGSAIADGKLSVTDTESSARQFFSLIKAFALWPQLFGYRTTLDSGEATKVAEEAVRLFLNGYASDASVAANAHSGRRHGNGNSPSAA